ncbi:hypothetical protein DAPPUDRAFT_266217 [Daphnia pulex]|uniref:Uncharacterized protein n=1 Tax=Daphnia pulex TaxID=6669 RepID=E9HUP0_DAPPU|nr:hypothetical protein DAPPUDRAFT_266217 [Daphnia pulex]|eukprot:EFX64549.1 hypothetical protein DAPPUDRAFT_266217 [Daphnia pulex]
MPSSVGGTTYFSTGMNYGTNIDASVPESSYGPASTNTCPPITLTINSHRPSSIPFPSNVYAPPFVPNSSVPPEPPPNPYGHDGAPGIYTPDDWIHTLGTPFATKTRSSVKPPRMKVPNFDGDPSNMPIYSCTTL